METRDGDRGRAEHALLHVLWKWKVFIAAGTAVVVLITGVTALLAPRAYEASVLLLVGSSSISDPAGSPPRVLNADTVVSIIASPSIAAEAIRRFELDRPPHRQTPGRFLADTLAVRPLSGTSLVRITVSLREPELAARTANFVADSVIQLNARATQSDATATRDYVMRQRDQAAAALDVAQAALRDFKRDSNLDAVRTQLRISLEEQERLTRHAASIATQQVGLRAQVREWAAALSEQRQLVTLRKSIVTDPAAVMAARQRGVDESELAGFRLENEEVNTIHQNLRRELINAQAELASYEEQRRDTERKLRDNERTIASTSARLSALEARLEELTHLYGLAKATHALMAKKVDEAELSVAARATELKLVERATGQLEPRDRGVAVKVVIAALAALASFSALAVGLDAVWSLRRAAAVRGT